MRSAGLVDGVVVAGDDLVGLPVAGSAEPVARRVDVLGPVLVTGPNPGTAVTRPMEIAVVSVLALHADSPVPVASLIDLLWPTGPPRTAAKTLQGYVKRVRAAAAAQTIEVRHDGPAGYVLRIPPDRVDALQFESLVAGARLAADDDVRVRRLDAALALWRGEPFGGCALDGLAPHRDWLTRLHTATQVERAASRVRLGATGETVLQIRGLLGADPTNERLWLHLAAAHYLLGNPPAALDTIAEARRQLDARVGVAPGPELAELQGRILRHDDVAAYYHRVTGAPLRATGSATSEVSRRPPVALELPVWSGPLVGRERDLAAVTRLIDGPARVVTLTGPGGIGKTRCASAAAEAAMTPCLGFLDLSETVSATGVALHLAGSFGVPDRDDPVAAVAGRLAGPRSCVVLDNVEQVDGIATLVRDLVRACPDVVWLVTSQRELGLESEHVVRLEPLGQEGRDEEPSESAALLLGAARRRGGHLEAAKAERVVARVGGLPLALELAACQLQYLDAEALIRALDDPVATLVDPRRAIARHRSVTAFLDLGLDRLSPTARELLALISGRAGGTRYDDLMAGWTADIPLARAVAELVEVGFAQTRLDAVGATRVTQLPLVRAFGRNLPPSSWADAMAAALDAGVLARAQATLGAPRSGVIEPDLPDVRRLLRAGVNDPARHEIALLLAASLMVFWWEHRITEGRRWLDLLLSAGGGAVGTSPVRPHAEHAAAFLDFYLGDAQAARRRLGTALAAEPADPAARARLLAQQAMLDAAADRHDLAAEGATAAITLSREAGDLQGLCLALGNAGDVAAAGGDPAGARDHYVACIENLRRAGLDWLSAAPTARLGDVDLAAGERRRARMWFDRSISLWSARDLGPGAPQALAGLARLDVVEGNLVDARRGLDLALATAQRCASRGEYTWVALGYAGLLTAEGRGADAAILFALALRLGPQAGLSIRRIVEAEFAEHYGAVWHDGVADEPIVLATPLEDLPATIVQILAW